MSSEFEKYAVKHCGISSLRLHDFRSVISDYVSPTIIEERQLNVATMDVFSRLMMDRIIFLGAPIYDDAANIIQAQLLFLESADPEKDIQLYINSPGVMIHQPLGGAQGQASDIEITAREILRTKRELYEILASHAGVPIKKIEKDADRDYWMTADEAKNYGLIDEVLKKRK